MPVKITLLLYFSLLFKYHSTEDFTNGDLFDTQNFKESKSTSDIFDAYKQDWKTTKKTTGQNEVMLDESPTEIKDHTETLPNDNHLVTTERIQWTSNNVQQQMIEWTTKNIPQETTVHPESTPTGHIDLMSKDTPQVATGNISSTPNCILTETAGKSECKSNNSTKGATRQIESTTDNVQQATTGKTKSQRHELPIQSTDKTESTRSLSVEHISRSHGTTLSTSNAPILSDVAEPYMQQLYTKEHSTSTESLNVKTKLPDDICDRTGACPPDGTDWYCHCDLQCQEYNDCCQESKVSRPKPSMYKCLVTDQTRNNRVGFYAIGTCPDWYSDSLIFNKCSTEDIFEFGPPVVNKNNDSQIFANQYCAMCHNVMNISFMSVQYYGMIEVRMEDILNASDASSLRALNKNSIKYRILPKDTNNIRKCLTNLIESNSSECQRYINPIAILDTQTEFFRNLFCIDTKIRNDPSTRGGVCFGVWSTSSSTWTTQLSVIFNFGGQTQSSKSDEQQCKVWSEKVDILCSHLPSYMNGEIVIEFELKTIITSEEIQVSDLLLRQASLMAMWTFEIHKEIKIKEFTTFKAENSLNVRVEIVLVIMKRVFRQELLQITKGLEDRMISISLLNDINDKMTVGFVSAIVSKNETFTAIRSVVCSNNYYFDHFNRLHIDINSHVVTETCKKVNILTTMEDSKLKLVNFQCDNAIDAVITDNETPILAVITYTCFSISIVALVLCIIVNRKMEPMMTVPRTNLENISISLMLASCLFLAGIGATQLPTVCYVIGIVLHFLFLATFVFMTIGVITISFRVNQMRIKRNIPQNKIKRQRVLVTIVGLVVPCLFVGPAIFIDIEGPVDLSPGYGQTACFPTRFPGNIIFFSGPVMLLTGLNLASLVYTIVKVEQTRMETRSLLKTSRTFDDLKMFLRLVTLSAVPWIIGIVAVGTSSIWLEYIFTLTCGLQGLFISVANLTTQRAKQLLMSCSKADDNNTIEGGIGLN